jgi:hypothetical protein
MKNLFPIIVQSITKGLRNNDISQAKLLTNEIDKLLIKNENSLILALTKNSRLILNLSRSNRVGLIVAWLFIRAWFFIKHDSVNVNNKDYRLLDLINMIYE